MLIFLINLSKNSYPQEIMHLSEIILIRKLTDSYRFNKMVLHIGKLG